MISKVKSLAQSQCDFFSLQSTIKQSTFANTQWQVGQPLSFEHQVTNITIVTIIIVIITESHTQFRLIWGKSHDVFTTVTI